MQKDQYILSSVSNTLEILDLLNDYDKLSLAQICKLKNMNKASVFRMLYTLEKKRYVDKDGTGKYSLNIKFARFGTKLLDRQNILLIAKPYLETLRNEYNETTHLSILSNDNNCVIIHKEKSTQPMQMSSAIGGEMDIYCSATGKIITSYLDKELIEKKLTDLNPIKYTKNTKIDIQSIRNELKLVALNGFAEDLQERDIGLTCYAFPIFDINKKCIGAISISGKSKNMSNNRGSMLSSLKNMSYQISMKLGYNKS
jgi:DNA-binding IclR family transcriptional regulator